MDNEIKGEGLQLDYGFRIYDPRIGKFLSQDPLFKEFAYLTPYQYASNNPIMNIDIDGLEGFPANALQGSAGELFVKSKLDLVKGYDVYEQITMRPFGQPKTFNSRVDFLIRSQSTGNVYTLDVKTGGATSSPNQSVFDNSIADGQLSEIRTAKPNGGSIKGDQIEVAGNAVIRVNGNNELTVESTTINPKAKHTDELKHLSEKLEGGNKKGDSDTNSKGKGKGGGGSKIGTQTLPIVVPMVMPTTMPVIEVTPMTVPEIFVPEFIFVVP
jgi:RHS repeat-associated protein